MTISKTGSGSLSDSSTAGPVSDTRTYAWVPSYPGELPASQQGRLTFRTTGTLDAHSTVNIIAGAQASVSSSLDGSQRYQTSIVTVFGMAGHKDADSGSLVTYKGPFQAATFNLSASIEMTSSVSLNNGVATDVADATADAGFTRLDLDLKP